MKTHEFNQETLEDLVFENRNKEYGAYQLRKSYKYTLFFAFLGALLLLGGVVVYGIVISSTAKGMSKMDEKIVSVDIKSIHKEELPPALPPPITDVTPRLRLLAPKVVDSIDTDPGIITQDDLSNQTSVAIKDEPPENVVADSKPNVVEISKDEMPYVAVEIYPSFPGGDEARIRFLSENIKYPSEARQLGIQGKVFFSFVVEKDGSISNLVLIRGIGGGCDEEAHRVVSLMPKWSPGIQQGNFVRVQLTMAVKFTLRD